MEVLEMPLITRDSGTDYLQLYEELFPVCAKWVRSMSGSLADAEDIFQDALVIYLEKDPGTVSLVASREAYVLGITKHLWIRKYEKSRSTVSLNAIEKLITIPDDAPDSPAGNPVSRVNTVRLLNFLERAGRNCLDLLVKFYFEKLPMKELSPAMGYRNHHSATVQKYKCIEKLRTFIKEKSLNYEDFTD